VPSAEHWDNLAAARTRQAKTARGHGAPSDSRYSSVRRRFYAYLLDSVLGGALIGIGWLLSAELGSIIAILPFAAAWLVWSILAWRNGQSPAKQLLGMYVVHDGRPASWKRMAVRELVAKPVAGIACGAVTVLAHGLPALIYFVLCLVAWVPYYFWMVFDAENRALWDQPCGTHVVEEREVF
jgi:uncharacterized RDD family membrane protein YckC